MRFGFFTMPERVPWSNWTLSYDLDIEQIVLAEKLGFEEYWIGEHHSGGYEPVPAPELLIAKASALTHRIQLATGTVNLPYHDPFLVAERMAFLDHLTHGRLIYGFGGGALVTDQTLLGIDPAEVRERTDEALGIVETLLSSREPFTHHGKFWQFENRRIQVPPYHERAPIALAGLKSTYNFELCATRGYYPVAAYSSPLHRGKNLAFTDLVEMGLAMDRAALAAGRDPAAVRNDWRISREIYISDDKNTAIAEIREGANISYDYLKGIGIGAVMKNDPDMSDDELTIDWFIENSPWLIGSPEDVVRQLHELNEEVGGFGVFLLNSRDWTRSTTKWYRSIELFARYVMPAFRAREHQGLRRELANQALGLA